MPSRKQTAAVSRSRAAATGLTPASDDELTNASNTMHYVTVSPPVLLGARKTRVSLSAIHS